MTKSGTGCMLINIVLLVMGLVVILKGADWLTDGAVNIASRFGVSQMVIGLTIVAMGTSMPEVGQEGQQRHCHWQRHWLKRL